MTKLLLDIQQLRLTLEELPIGSICLSSDGLIQSVDSSTEARLKYQPGKLALKHITLLFQHPAFDLLEAMRTQSFGYSTATELRTSDGNTVPAQIVLADSIQPQLYVFSIFLSTDD